MTDDERLFARAITGLLRHNLSPRTRTRLHRQALGDLFSPDHPQHNAQLIRTHTAMLAPKLRERIAWNVLPSTSDHALYLALERYHKLHPL